MFNILLTREVTRTKKRVRTIATTVVHSRFAFVHFSFIVRSIICFTNVFSHVLAH